MKNKIYLIMFSVALIFCITGCGKHGELHEYDDVIIYVNDMQCGLYDKDVSCNLAGKFELVDTYDETDYKGDPTRTYTLKLKDDDFSFDIISYYGCTDGLNIDGSCYDYTCYLNGNDYYDKAEKYHINRFNEEFDFNNKIKNYSFDFYDTSNSSVGRFKVRTVDDLNFVVDYFNSYLDYVNGLDYKFFDFNYSLPFAIYFANYGYVYGKFDVEIGENNKYIFKFDDKYYPNDKKIETYIYNLMNSEGILLR